LSNKIITGADSNNKKSYIRIYTMTLYLKKRKIHMDYINIVCSTYLIK